jgi:ABC-type transporter MlaC component
MKIWITALTLSAAALLAHAQDANAPSAQQNLMKSCNADAASKSLKGDERKQFMSSCLKG